MGFQGVMGIQLSAFFGLGLLYYLHQIGVYGWVFGLLQRGCRVRNRC